MFMFLIVAPNTIYIYNLIYILHHPACISQSLRVRQCSSRLEGHSLLDTRSLFGKGIADTDGGLTTERIPTQTLLYSNGGEANCKKKKAAFTRACQCISVLFFFTIAKIVFWCQSVVLYRILLFWEHEFACEGTAAMGLVQMFPLAWVNNSCYACQTWAWIRDWQEARSCPSKNMNHNTCKHNCDCCPAYSWSKPRSLPKDNVYTICFQRKDTKIVRHGETHQ